MIYYLVCAWFYTHEPLDLAAESRDAMDLELAKWRILPIDSSVNAETEQERYIWWRKHEFVPFIVLC